MGLGCQTYFSDGTPVESGVTAADASRFIR
jgi:hypothetical protein